MVDCCPATFGTAERNSCHLSASSDAAASDPILAIARTAQARRLLSEAVICEYPPKQGPAVDSGLAPIHNRDHRRVDLDRAAREA